MSHTISTDPDPDRSSTAQDMARLQFTTLLYYLQCTNPDNGLVRDKTKPNAPASIAAIGMALATIPVIVERGVIVRELAAKITGKRLRFLLDCRQGPELDASGHNGFFYHFLDMETGRRAWQCELSTIDSAFLFAGALTAATYFDRDTADEAEIRQLGMALAFVHRQRYQRNTQPCCDALDEGIGQGLHAAAAARGNDCGERGGNALPPITGEDELFRIGGPGALRKVGGRKVSDRWCSGAGRLSQCGIERSRRLQTVQTFRYERGLTRKHRVVEL
ncbi:hypothetical protein AB3480_28155, partial [Rhizobium mongolense]